MKINNLSNQELEQQVIVTLPVLYWMAVHGNLCLALRHPQNNGPSRASVIHSIELIESVLKDQGLMDQEDIDLVHQTEQDFNRFEGFTSQS